MWLTAILLGFAGGFHCIGMCSPLAFTATRGKTFLLNKALYNSGRIVTYGIMGAVVSSTGYFFVAPGVQNLLSILLGIGFLLMGFSGMTNLRLPIITTLMMHLSSFIKFHFVKFLTTKTKASVFILGTLNGILPCGLTFVALTSCLVLPGPLSGFCFMILFGVATLPAMVGGSGVLRLVICNFKLSPQKVGTGLLTISGVLLIARVLFVHLPQAPTISKGLADIVLCR
jgi:sulfite exporter TauE/SafE